MIKHKLLTLLVAICAMTALWASNTITYTATWKLTRSTLNVGATTFGPAIISHEFSNGIGTITCSGEITTIGDEAFAYCVGLTTVTIPNSVTTIGEYAFDGCSGLTTVTIPNSVTTIGDLAFLGCFDLTSVTIGNSVTTIGYGAFYGCFGLTTVTIPNSVTTIGESAFCSCSGLTSINIPNSVTTIGEGAFAGCRGLTSINIPNSVTTIGEGAFGGCYMTSINVDAANTHYASIDGVLFNYTKDTLILYPIGNPRTGYTIPNSVTTIGDDAFRECSGLQSVTIPNSVTTIGNYAFRECSGLQSVTIPNSVTTIGYGAFYGCSGLTSVTIPNSVTTIGDDAFSNCYSLTSITCEATTPPACGYSCFNKVDESIPLYVLAGSVNAYKAADEWKDFTNIRPIAAEEVEVTEIEAEPTESAVEIAWPSVVNAETYTIEIRLGDQLICSIVFNAQGQLVSINFNLAPGRGGHTYATTAESTATGWAYTIAGLNPGTQYTYSVIAKNADEQVIDTKSGSFTTHDMPMNIEIVNADGNTNKFLRNGQVIIRQGDKTYNVVGQEVK